MTTDESGGFTQIPIWAIPGETDTTYHQYDIVVDKQGDGGNTDKYNSASDGIDSASVAGFTAPVIELHTIILLGMGLLGLGGFFWYRRHGTAAISV